MSIKREQLHQKFQEEYQKLNPQQQLAVDTIEGPVMVIAGPGTGKTQILASRIGKILLETDVVPGNILCLTYTDAGVVAMRKRLVQFIGPDAYRVNIYTFHAFCNDIIQENLSLFEKTSLDPVSDLEKIEIFTQLIDSFPKNHPLKRYRGDVYFEIHNLQSLFSTMKKEGWTPEFINSSIDAYLEDLPNREEFVYKRAYKQFKAGDIKKEKIEEEKERMDKLRAAVNEFDRFQQLMRGRNRYDFDDMINWVIQAFRTNKNLLARYQEQYLYILVDEYQDTSGTQNILVELLINYWDKPNVFVVGDDDQSIYRFQGANVENMEAFARQYREDLLKVVLTNNYRSTQPILDVSKTLISQNNKRLVNTLEGLTKDLVSSHPRLAALAQPAAPTIREYESQQQEMIGITLQVQQLLDQGVQPGHIGIIYKENKYGEELAQYFTLRNIPVYSKRNLNILELPLVQQIMLVLKYLATEHDIPYSGDEMLFEILHFNWFGIPPIEIARLTAETSNRQFSGEKTTLRRLLHEKANTPPRDLFTPATHEGLRKASLVLEKLIGLASNITLQQLFEALVREAGVLGHIMQSPEKLWLLQVLNGLFDFVKEETRRQPLLNVQQLVTTIELMEREELPLPLVRISGSDKGVNLLTAHGSKGLEFEHVFLAGANSAFWEKKRKPGGGYKLPDTIFSMPAQATAQADRDQPTAATGSVESNGFGTNQGATAASRAAAKAPPAAGKSATNADLEELRRLFYVALTRAAVNLHISYSRFKNDGKELEPSIFIAEIQDQHRLPVEKMIIDENIQAEFQALAFSEGIAPEIGRLEEDFVGHLLDKFVMNVTALNNYLHCPLEFYFQNLIRIPSPKNENTEFGSAVHHALEKLFRKMQENGDRFPAQEEFIDDFNWYMRRHRESFTREQFQRRMEYGQEVLANYYDNYLGKWTRIVAVERNIRNVVVAGVPLKGKLDKLEFDGKTANVVDYKTGDPDKARPKLQPPHEKEPNGGDYWRQAVFYKILVDNYEQKDWKVVSTEFDFIEPDKKKQYRKEKVVISPQDITTVTQQIKMVWEKVQARDFYTGCGKETCHWCNFVKTNNLAVALHELQEEEETDN
ncbi:MAG: ATP-dependent DNA helicase [Candidatus Pseudobacter hemicellulosilyticus]|uniref:DNA 3'-5' helicase n=1 Tax=Candidatus Pseudobacter hemicellulosilyticus TaxID=3121375 RepID=A0AAJ6BJA6_9BACT|nr:MAG: ATP-dependent DNA helicase [Pseudobacter sp.]